jgi:hypothetical protein
VTAAAAARQRAVASVGVRSPAKTLIFARQAPQIAAAGARSAARAPQTCGETSRLLGDVGGDVRRAVTPTGRG